MRHTRRPARLAALTLCLVLIAGACGTDDEPADDAAVRPQQGTPKDGGTVTVGAEQFPKILNFFTPEGNTLWTGMTAGVALARGFKYTPDFGYHPWLFDGDCQVTSPQPYTVNCRIVREAKWSDGTDLTAEDFKFTVDTIMDRKNKVISRDGYDKIQTFNVKGPKEFEMVFSQVHAPWRELWSSADGATLPKHVLQGQDFNTVWNDCICDPRTKKPVGSGPFLVESFTAGTGPLTLVRNQTYWGRTRPKLDKVVFRPIAQTDAEINAFRAGEVEVIFPQNQLRLREKIPVQGAVYESNLGPTWEHFDMRSDVPGLDDVEVRRAIATALPRRQILDRLVKPADDRAQVLHNVFYMANHKSYQPHWNIYPESGDVKRATEILERAGYTKGADGIYAKGGTKLDFTVGVTAGNQARELTEQVIQQQLLQAGIKLTPQNSEDMLTTKLPNFQYQTIIYAWVGGPDPASSNTIWRSDTIPAAGDEDATGQNYTKVRNAQVTDLLKRTDVETDERRRVELYNQADDILAKEGITSIPLYQKPQPLAYRNTLLGLKNNATEDGFTWNIEEWAFKA